MVGRAGQHQWWGLLTKTKIVCPIGLFLFHSILHLASLFICKDNFCMFLCDKKRTTGGKECAFVEFFKGTGPLPVPLWKWNCCYKAGSGEMKKYLLAIWTGIWLNWRQHHLNLKFRVSRLRALDKTWQFVHLDLYTKMDPASSHLEFKSLCLFCP